MIVTFTPGIPVLSRGNGLPRTGSRARLVRQHGCRTPHDAPRTPLPGKGILAETHSHGVTFTPGIPVLSRGNGLPRTGSRAR
ncbi:hypothetical protein, partial [Chloroflexus sp.]|uniref:hypothetical protein n=1 Tax=Chloroflexus sp. TaxID=1904827 RepID=UPI00404A4D2A